MSRQERKARSYAERHGIPKWYTDAQELIDDPDVNAIYIATPPSSHATFAIMAMKAGKPVYVEKPLAASYEDCARINRISAETGVPCFVAYYRRYLPYFQKVKELVDNGTIGKVINVQIRFAVPPRELDYTKPLELPWRLQPDIAGAVISMIWLLISSTLCNTCSESSLRLVVFVPIAASSTMPKTRSVPVSSLKAVCPAVAHGAL